jgi:lantibiotic modifying enzyme
MRNDLFCGAAGFLLALTVLHRVAPSSELLDQIGFVADQLLRNAKPASLNNDDTATAIGWPLDADGPSLCGLAHGNAGVALALMEAWRSTTTHKSQQKARPELLLAGIHRALAYERSLRDDAAKNWADLRRSDHQDSSRPAMMATWCNGAPGIALARSRMLELGADLADDLAMAIETTKHASLSLPAGHLCCGTAGVDEILFEVGVRNGNATQIEIARRRTMARLLQAEQADNGEWPHVVTQAFMRGSAGIGYGLLRMTRAGRDAQLPCVLDLS